MHIKKLEIIDRIIRKVASLYMRFALQISAAQGNLTLLYSKNLRFFLYNK